MTPSLTHASSSDGRGLPSIFLQSGSAVRVRVRVIRAALQQVRPEGGRKLPGKVVADTRPPAAVLPLSGVRGGESAKGRAWSLGGRESACWAVEEEGRWPQVASVRTWLPRLRVQPVVNEGCGEGTRVFLTRGGEGKRSDQATWMFRERPARGCLQWRAVSPLLPTLEGAPAIAAEGGGERGLRGPDLQAARTAPPFLTKVWTQNTHPIPQVRDSPGHCPHPRACPRCDGHPTFRSPPESGAARPRARFQVELEGRPRACGAKACPST